MFNSKKKSKIDPDSTDTLIGEGTQFEGNIKSEASIRIEGRITGDIVSNGDVTVGDQGTANSSISARNVIVAGVVRGNVMAKEKLTITATGQLHGNTSSKTLIIDDGGLFMGNSKMETAKAKNPEKEQSSASSSQPFNRNYNDSAANL